MRNEKLTEIETICNRLIDRADLVEDAERILELLAELDKQDWECTLAAANETAYRVALEELLPLWDNWRSMNPVPLTLVTAFERARTAIATADRNKSIK